jgi:hypothetical protein
MLPFLIIFKLIAMSNVTERWKEGQNGSGYKISVMKSKGMFRKLPHNELKSVKADLEKN